MTTFEEKLNAYDPNWRERVYNDLGICTITMLISNAKQVGSDTSPELMKMKKECHI